MSIDIDSIRDRFPATQQQFAQQPLIYLDSAATYLKPRAVIDAVTECYETMAGTVGRGVHLMADQAIEEYQLARESIANFINAEADEIVFVRNATEALNVVSLSLKTDSIILGSLGEHHSNLLPWRTRHRVQYAGLLEDGMIDLPDFQNCLVEHRPALVAISTIGNAFGTVQPFKQVIECAHASDHDVLLDASQSIAHHPIDVRELDCDYLCFSGHKLGGPTGVGVLFAKRSRLEKLQPLSIGGGSVTDVGMDNHQLADLPMRLEAGTAAFEAVLGLAAACDFISDVGLESIEAHERCLTLRLLESIENIDRIAIRGSSKEAERGAIVAFQIEGLEAHGAARMLSKRANICVRSGFHCAQPAHEHFGWRPTVRASFGMYNTVEEVDVLVDTLKQITANIF